MSDTISLIPDSLIQFDTVRLNASDCARLRCSFWEDPTGIGHDGMPETICAPWNMIQTTMHLSIIWMAQP